MSNNNNNSNNLVLFRVNLVKTSKEGRDSCEMQQTYHIVHLKGPLFFLIYLILLPRQQIPPQITLPSSSHACSLECISFSKEN